MLNTVVETSVQTGDSRNIVLFIVLAVIALVLLVLCTVMAGAGKKNQISTSGIDAEIVDPDECRHCINRKILQFCTAYFYCNPC